MSIRLPGYNFGYNWDDIKKQMIGATEEKPEPPKPEPVSNSINRENSWSFFSNPRSDWEDRRKRMTEDYKKEMQLKFQEKVENDKRRRYPVQISKNPESPEKTNSYPESFRFNNSRVSYPSFESPPAPNKVEYYSPQVKSKFSPDPFKSSPQALQVLKSSQPLQSLQGLQPSQPESSFKQLGANLTYDQSRSLREKQLEEWRRSVQEQLEERNKLKEEEKSRKMMEDKLEEAKIKREVEELNKKHLQEIRFETGFVEENSFQPTRYEPPRPPPKVEEREAYPVRKPTKMITKPREDYRIRHEIILQEAGIRDIIHQIKAEANHAAAERQEILQDLERMKFEIKNTRVFDPFSYSFNYSRPFYLESNRFMSFSNAGKSIVNGSWGKNEELRAESQYFTKVQKREYHEIANQETLNQIQKLDQIIFAKLQETEEFDEGNQFGEPVKNLESQEKVIKEDSGEDSHDAAEVPVEVIEEDDVKIN
jgi:hypothetical protein